jgi:hypothetical protein
MSTSRDMKNNEDHYFVEEGCSIFVWRPREQKSKTSVHVTAATAKTMNVSAGAVSVSVPTDPVDAVIDKLLR